MERGTETAVDVIIAGGAPDALVERLRRLEAESGGLREQSANLEPQAETITLHPAAAGNYRRMIGERRNHLDRISEGHHSDALLDMLRTMIKRSTITPKGKCQPVDMQVHGHLQSCGHQKRKSPANSMSSLGFFGCGSRI